MKCLAAGDRKGVSTFSSTGSTPKCSEQRIPRRCGEEWSLSTVGRPGRRKNFLAKSCSYNSDTVLFSAKPVSLQTHVRSLGSAGHYLSGVTKRSILGGFSA